VLSTAVPAISVSVFDQEPMVVLCFSSRGYVHQSGALVGSEGWFDAFRLRLALYAVAPGQAGQRGSRVAAAAPAAKRHVGPSAAAAVTMAMQRQCQLLARVLCFDVV
jgi:hypothetical protein